MRQIKQIFRRALRYIIKGVPTYYTTANVSYLSPEKRLVGKHIVVTGGGRGLGYAMAKRFVEEGAKVLIAGRNEEVLKKSSKTIGCEWICIDMQNVDSFDKFFVDAIQKIGFIDCLVNNAGISLHEEDYSKVTPESFDMQISTNLRGAFFLTQKYLEIVKKGKQKASILFISSETGETADERPYGWTKAATNSMVRGLAYKLAKDGIRVNALAPGVTASDMTGYKEDGNLYRADSITRRVYLPDEIAEVACFILSDLSGCISGQIFTCNNGNTINARWK